MFGVDLSHTLCRGQHLSKFILRNILISSDQNNHQREAGHDAAQQYRYPPRGFRHLEDQGPGYC